MKWTSIVFAGCLLVACGEDEPNPGSGGAGGHAEGGGGDAAEGGGGAGGHAEGGGGHAEGGGGAGGHAEGGGGAGGHAEGGGGAGGHAEGGGGAGGHAEGGGGAGGHAEGGGGGAGGGGLASVELAIAADEYATAGCATFVAGAWGVGETDFSDGEPTNDECALVPVMADGEPFWIASREFEGDIHLEGLEHSFSTAAALISETSYSLVLLNFTFEEIFSGSLTVTYLTDDTVTLSIE
ncbi:hypothetical protein WME75_38710 [Sorangium sp. So ce1014]|uniref:hypothetical protein n=1 Tax=Sorangium sp. So ce1014 TaxID=3133326 RepID=UPI003F6226DD